MRRDAETAGGASALGQLRHSETAWRENNRRESTIGRYRELISLALLAPAPSPWTGYWQRRTSRADKREIKTPDELKKLKIASEAVIALANDRPCYIPTLEGFKQGSYEAENSRVVPGTGERLVEVAKELLKDLKR